LNHTVIRLSIRNPQLNQDALWLCQYPEKSTEGLRTIARAATRFTYSPLKRGGQDERAPHDHGAGKAAGAPSIRPKKCRKSSASFMTNPLADVFP
jgi:hypothetical protein